MSDHDTWNMFAAAVAPKVCTSIWSMSLAEINDNAAQEGHTGNVDTYIAFRVSNLADALLAESKKRETPAEPTPPQPDDDGWIKWEGGECPVGPVVVDVQFRDGDRETKVPASEIGWAHEWGTADVVAYRIVSKAGVTK